MMEPIWLRTLGGLHRQRITRGVRRSAAAMPFRPASWPAYGTINRKCLQACYSREGRGRAGRVLHLEPMRRAPRAIHRVLTLRHDAFESHLAGMGEDGRAVALHVLVEAQARPALASILRSVALRTSSGSRRRSSRSTQSGRKRRGRHGRYGGCGE